MEPGETEELCGRTGDRWRAAGDNRVRSSSPDARSRREAAPGSQPSALPLCLSPRIQRRRTGRPLCFVDDFHLGHKSFFIRRALGRALQMPVADARHKLPRSSPRSRSRRSTCPKTVIGRSQAACSTRSRRPVTGKQDRVTGLIGDSSLFQPSRQTTTKLPKQDWFRLLITHCQGRKPSVAFQITR